jgi:hypothetical protein
VYGEKLKTHGAFHWDSSIQNYEGKITKFKK